MPGVHYSPEVVDELLRRLSTSDRSIARICEDEDMPSREAFYEWLRKDPALVDRYARAKEMQCDAIADGIRDIAADGRNDWMKRLAFNGGNPGWELNGEHINRSRLRIDAEKWLLSKLMPKKYGDKVQQEVSGPDGGAVPINLVRVEFVKPKE